MAVVLNNYSVECIKIIEANIERTLEAIGLFVEGEAKKLSPIDTGNLRGSIEHDTSKAEKKVSIGTNVEYAIYQEMGTIYQKGKAFLRPAIENNITTVSEIAKSYMKVE